MTLNKYENKFKRFFNGDHFYKCNKLAPLFYCIVHVVAAFFLINVDGDQEEFVFVLFLVVLVKELYFDVILYKHHDLIIPLMTWCLPRSVYAL